MLSQKPETVSDDTFIDTLSGFLTDAEPVRLEELQKQWASGQSPDFTFDEMEQAGRYAWKNSERCIGRLTWNKLKLNDAREAKTSQEIFDACLKHLISSTNGGAITPTMTLLPSDRDLPGLKILSDQFIRYACYRLSDSELLGDPTQLEMTDLCLELGWEPPKHRTPFDRLPFLIEHPEEGKQWFEFPSEAVLEVPIQHQEFEWFDALNLKWHALPAVSNQNLTFGGLSYPAPFSGYYMGTEIGSRNFGDTDRYNLLPTIAGMMGLDTRREGSLWKDRALVELNSAVLYSFREAGVRIVDHHTASVQFQHFCKREEAAGNEVAGDWSWLVPPMSGSSCPVFHRYYSDKRPEPRFV
ncbi:MAG: nitric oxide synthase oxygenase [Verrucomicrobiota bacterium]